jgi:flavorubredoxin
MIADNDITGKILYEDSDHKFIWLGTESKYRKGVIQTMQYLIIDKGRGTLLDPGGVHLFSRVVASVSRYISIDKIDTIFFSHQDPDVSSGIALWLGVTNAKVYVSALWTRFLPHFGIVDTSRVLPIEDKGMSIRLPSGAEMNFVPAHFMHSPGHFCLYDTRSRILFSGDIGAAVFGETNETLFVESFTDHLPLIEGFHKRYMASNSVVRKWCAIVSRLNPDMIAPQHGAIYRGDSVKSFLSWLAELRCGVDLADQFFGV